VLEVDRPTHDPNWRNNRECIGRADEFVFDGKYNSSKVQKAIDICSSCVAIEPCLETAVVPSIGGIVQGGEYLSQNIRSLKQ